MTEDRDEILHELNELQAESGIDPETRYIIGLLGTTIHTLGEQIDDLQQRVEELESGYTPEESQEYTWYSNR
ncbi:hypothetical protein [Halomicrococcus sp. NG-SE-24]|uniref:hypothetical protein n=1 Tax=Halomicrococcus sp. NG-SE-24 TaxID=3436928 RepID=UPI003D96C6AA